NARNIECEHVIIDNDSTDDTNKIVTDWISRYPNINSKIIIERKKGLSNARNCGIQNSKGELVIFTDDDCRMTVDYINKAFELYKNDNALVLRGGDVQLGNSEDFPTSIRTGTQLVEYALLR